MASYSAGQGLTNERTRNTVSSPYALFNSAVERMVNIFFFLVPTPTLKAEKIQKY